jgi:hypothetical protein
VAFEDLFEFLGLIGHPHATCNADALISRGFRELDDLLHSRDRPGFRADDELDQFAVLVVVKSEHLVAPVFGHRATSGV